MKKTNNKLKIHITTLKYAKYMLICTKWKINNKEEINEKRRNFYRWSLQQ